VVSINLTSSEQLIVRMKFDSYIKKCIKNELKNILRKEELIRKREILIPDYEVVQIDISYTKSMTADYVVKGHEITISDSNLFYALEKLEPRDREIILLIYFMGYKPEDISKQLDVGERTVYNWHKKILDKLKKLMG
jgi:RNA polymerase sigma factor (sigma-70 family)